MGLNIKDERTHRLVRELARRTESTQTAAVRDAVERRLAEIGSGRDEAFELEERRRRMLDIVRDFQAELTEEDRHRMQRADDWLYDERGLPR